MKNSILIKCTLLILCISFNSCLVQDGEDGVDGIDGKNGIDGIDGIDGINGQDGQDGAPGATGPQGDPGNDGQDGAGLDQMAQYGSITMNLNGTRPDDMAFTDNTEFRFLGLDGEDFVDYNIVVPTVMGVDTQYFFNFRRFLTAPDGTYNPTYFDWEVTITNPGEATETVDLVETTLNNYGVIGEDNKYFLLDEGYDSDGVGISNMQLINITYESENGNHLSFSYSFTVDAANNGSGNELNVSGEVDVYLFELIEP
ncbi:collagen-like protein [Flagellimonas marinaquae]|uniref:collagen-like protein n=1 Tax=Flagellimonas marinaquae TaxID=254955 RepID=UPI002075E912|nr:collagen-like protein [Allomuricauda aquimarina]USD24057.1 collagen-like protein [Allomuricauda aquimarina]